MIYTEVEKKELDEVQRVFAEHLRQCPDYELLWSDSLRILLAKDEKDFPWNEDLIQAAEAMCREFLTSKGFAVPAAEQPDGKQEKDGGNDDEREKT